MDTAPSEFPKGYHTLRYQTKAYDELPDSVNFFTQDGREFLEGYGWLRQVPEFFKPEDVFSVINNAEAQNEIVKSSETSSLTMKDFAVQSLAHFTQWSLRKAVGSTVIAH